MPLLPGKIAGAAPQHRRQGGASLLPRFERGARSLHPTRSLGEGSRNSELPIPGSPPKMDEVSDASRLGNGSPVTSTTEPASWPNRPKSQRR